MRARSGVAVAFVSLTGLLAGFGVGSCAQERGVHWDRSAIPSGTECPKGEIMSRGMKRVSSGSITARFMADGRSQSESAANDKPGNPAPLKREPIQIDPKLGRIIYVDMRYPVMRKDRLTIAETKRFARFALEILNKYEQIVAAKEALAKEPGGDSESREKSRPQPDTRVSAEDDAAGARDLERLEKKREAHAHRRKKKHPPLAQPQADILNAIAELQSDAPERQPEETGQSERGALVSIDGAGMAALMVR
ncbi:MAG: hypothetical protein LBJ42_02570, partial [Holosporales bacterium]|nr:hypothetical protein [Holosporales bacterium]